MSRDPLELGEPEFLGWRLLVGLKSQSNDQISRSKFLKLCCITDRHLLEEYEYDVGLARYWYMYGELTNEHEFSGRFYNAPQAIGWEGQQYIPKPLSIEAFDVTDEGLRLIHQAVNWAIQEFGKLNVESIKQHQYEEYAENAFIREYSELRWLLNTVDLGEQYRLNNYASGGESNEEYLLRKLDEMLECYPRDEERYGEVKPLYLRWDDTVRLMVDQSIEFSRIAEFLDDFIEMLSKCVLRFNYNQHISEERLRSWEDDAAEAQSAFASELREVRGDLLKNRERSTELDGISGAYSKTIEGEIEKLLARE